MDIEEKEIQRFSDVDSSPMVRIFLSLKVT